MEAATTVNVCDHENIEAVTLNVCDQVDFSYDLELDGNVDCSLDLDAEEDPVVTVKSVNIYHKFAYFRTKVLVRLQGLRAVILLSDNLDCVAYTDRVNHLY